MLKVALTGGIATGKSYVLDEFRRRGVPCLDADLIAHGVMAPGTEASTAIAARFGTDMLDATGAVNRAKLGSIVFADASARRELEAIVHPAVYRSILAGLRAFELIGGYSFAVVDVPLLYETGGEKHFDRVVSTTCPEELQMARLAERGLSPEAARQRLAAQWPADQKAARAEFVIKTDGTFEDTDRQVGEVLLKLRARCDIT